MVRSLSYFEIGIKLLSKEKEHNILEKRENFA